MAILIFQTNTIRDTGNAAVLVTAPPSPGVQPYDDAYVAAGVILGSLQFSAIIGQSFGHSVFVDGTVVGGRAGILLGENVINANTQQVFVTELGRVSGASFGGDFAAIDLNGFNSLVDNAGSVSGRNAGVSFTGSGAGTSSFLSNDGSITGGIIAVSKFGNEALNISNHGTIDGGTYSFFEGAGNAATRIVNSGLMVGDVNLNNGNDYFDGRLGNLEGSVLGGAGNDTLFGGIDDDIFNGGLGTDSMAGGGGDDTYVVDLTTDEVTEGVNRGNDTIQTGLTLSLADYTNVENIRLLGAANLAATGDANANLLAGNNGNNVLSGSLGNDVLIGNFGIDRLIGGAGIDRLFGGLSNDAFVFTAATDTGATAAAADRILDFAAGDRIDLSLIDANPFAAGNNAFTLDAGGAFTVGEIRQAQVGTVRVLTLNLDNDVAAEMAILVANVGALGGGAFIF